MKLQILFLLGLSACGLSEAATANNTRSHIEATVEKDAKSVGQQISEDFEKFGNRTAQFWENLFSGNQKEKKGSRLLSASSDASDAGKKVADSAKEGATKASQAVGNAFRDASSFVGGLFGGRLLGASGDGDGNSASSSETSKDDAKDPQAAAKAVAAKFEKLTNGTDWEKFAKSDEFKKFANGTDWQKFVNSPEFKKFTNGTDWQKFVNSDAVKKFTNGTDWQKIVSDASAEGKKFSDGAGAFLQSLFGGSQKDKETGSDSAHRLLQFEGEEGDEYGDSDEYGEEEEEDDDDERRLLNTQVVSGGVGCNQYVAACREKNSAYSDYRRLCFGTASGNVGRGPLGNLRVSGSASAGCVSAEKRYKQLEVKCAAIPVGCH
uniref:Uncharacterized protein n=1 Tax=Chromera velia CCMP2878 TaxID=1169474 RepID=A0A0G4GW02_9ALVE|eukprot:Cvel_23620.t1-p1 / transcript=Cvel_23620.t1 / gene=Cvel_23620 / organism=Chromera_velia_CCMP2878 / gene_product=hypothetical protein / transcript_product=hypothetical protein / location=Cvel_scaffold2454:4848-5978(-) / protein_length=377 / sequence_SO=supercontig / SO=protein_coding / is_pseudo=false